MSRGLYIAASGMVSGLARQFQLTNDLSNINTPGYKPDRIHERSFGGVLVRLGGRVTGRRVTLGAGGVFERASVDLTPAPLTQTGRPMDIAIDGDGFLVAQDDQGNLRLTRDGRLITDSEGFLATSTGLRLLDAADQPIAVAAGAVGIGTDGTVRVDGAAVGRLRLATAPDDALLRAGSTSFLLQDAAALTAAQNAIVRTGALEGSGVSSTRTLTDMMQTARSYESAQRVFELQNAVLGRTVTDVGRV